MSAPSTKLFAPLHETIATAPSAAEEQVLARWRTEGTFEALQRSRSGGKPFVFWEGPPTANGRPGIHHVFARTIKDTFCRYHTMRGRRVVRKAGWDTHGLPVELEVEKKLGISGKPQIEAYGVAKFNAECRASVWTYKQDWEQLSERIGFWLDYSDPYVTYEKDYVESIWYLLSRFHAKGLVYHGRRVLPYCGRCGTGLSSHELGQPGVYRDVQDPSVYVKFRLAAHSTASFDAHVRDPNGVPCWEYMLAWTTTPWTLPSNIALAVHPDREYVKVRVVTSKPTEARTWDVLWIVRERLSVVLEGLDFEELDKRTGRELAADPNFRYFPPFREPNTSGTHIPSVSAGSWQPTSGPPPHRVVEAKFVTVDDGTGIVHIAPAYGVDDWEVAKLNHLDVLQAVGSEGKFVCDVGPVKTGTFFKDADDALMEHLKQRDRLFMNKKGRAIHSYPHCWRCDTPLFYYATPAWYIRTTAYKDKMVEANKRIRWVPPEVGQKRFGEWLENNVDWNISRDRYWGTPLPFWTCGAPVNDGGGDRRECGYVVAVGSVAELEQLAGALPADFDNHKPLIDEVVFDCAKCGAKRSMRRTKAVLDCWFDSGAMPFAQYHWPFGQGRAQVADQFPADFIAEGLDQTRGWFYTLHAIGTFVTEFLQEEGLGAGPVYRTCVVNGLVLDKNGVKMSKRLGNVVDPWQAIREHGVDAVRWYLLSSGSPWLPKRFDADGILEVRRRLVGTLVNSYKFFADLARLGDGYDPRSDVAPPPAQRPEIDRWLLSRTQSLLADVRVAMENCDLDLTCRSVEAFVIDDLSNWYIRRNRRRFQRSGKGPDKTAAFASLHAALRAVAITIAPIMPFLSEMLWARLEEQAGSVHAELFPEPDTARIDRDLEESMRIVVRIVEMGRALRDRAGMKIRQPLRAIHIRSSHEKSLELLRTGFAREQILGELNIREIGSLAADDGELCTLKAKANFRVLGKRLGALMKPAASAIEALGPAQVAQLRAGANLSLSVGGESVTLTPEDVQIVVESRAEFDVETDGRFVLFLDTQLDDGLIAEGLLREAISRVNGLRKDSGLAVEDRIHLRLDSGGSGILDLALRTHQEVLCTETLAVELSFGPDPIPGGALARFDLGEQRVLVASLIRA